MLKAYKVLNKSGADDSLLKIVVRELARRGVDVGIETMQEELQEITTIAGTQLGSMYDTGEWAYSFDDVTERLWDTLTGSVLTFGLTNIPSGVHNTYVQNQNRLAAEGEARLLNKEMPSDLQLKAMGMSKPEALGKLVMLNLDQLDDAPGYQAETDFSSRIEDASKTEILEKNRLQGRLYEQHEFAEFSGHYSEAVEQITIKTTEGVRTRVDAIGLDAEGNVVINEFKSSSTAPLTRNQKIAFEEIFEGGGTVVGNGKGIFAGGFQIPAGTRIIIVRPK